MQSENPNLNLKIIVMKTDPVLRVMLTVVLSVSIPLITLGQVNPFSHEYELMKISGSLPSYPKVEHIPPIPTTSGILSHNETGCLLIPLDITTFTYLPRNDDGYTGLINLPFNFDFYGTVQTSCYINNNGNVSFGAPYWQYTSTGFPIGGFPMLAAFWADVDTRNLSSGLMWYKVEPHRIIVIWDGVGYYFEKADKLNTFELIFTDGTDPLIGLGNNVAFSYDDMQWTTGDVSGGSGGFGGTPATVGINKGDGITYALVGRFDHPGTDFDGAGGVPDGISYLDCKNFFFNTSTATNIPPVQSGFPSSPVTINFGATWTGSVQFLSPEIGQTTTTVLDQGGLTDFTFTSTPGNVSQIDMQVTGTLSNIGSHTVTFTATDNWAPAGVTVVTLEFVVLPPPCMNPTSGGEIAGSQVLCQDGDPVPFTSSSSPSGQTGNLEYLWQYSTDNETFVDIPLSNSETFDAAILNSTTWFRRLARVDCMPDWSGAAMSNALVVVVSHLSANAGPDQLVYYGYAPEECTLLVPGDPFGGIEPYSFLWNTGEMTTNIQVCPNTMTTYTLTVTDAVGCQVSDNVMVCVIDVRCGKYLKKVEICHSPPGNPQRAKTLCISAEDVADHLGHGDYLGACGTIATCPPLKVSSEPENELAFSDYILEATNNPCTKSTLLTYGCPEDGLITLTLMDISGRTVANLLQDEIESGYNYQYDMDVSHLSKGIYFCILQHSNGKHKVLKLMIN